MNRFKTPLKSMLSIALIVLLLVGLFPISPVIKAEDTGITQTEEVATTDEGTGTDSNSNTTSGSENPEVPPDTGNSEVEVPSSENPENPDEVKPEEVEPEKPEETEVAPVVVTQPGVVKGDVGDEATFSVKLSEEVNTTYQWQKMINKPIDIDEDKAVYDYFEGESTTYYFPFEDISEAELLEINPDATWPGIELYLAEVERTGDPNVKIEMGSKNTILDEGENPEVENAVWIDMEGETNPDLTFNIVEDDKYTIYRCLIKIEDAKYVDTLIEQGIPEEDITLDFMSDGTFVEFPEVIEPTPIARMSVFASIPKVSLSADNGWIVGLNPSVEYITKETYDRVGAEAAGNQYWTTIGEPSKVAGTRPDNTKYNSTALTEGNKMEVLSAWYGKTVYFRYKDTAGPGIVIKIPAYTSKDYQTGKSSLYKSNVKILNAYVDEHETSFYKTYVNNTLDENNYGPNGTHITVDTVPITFFNRNSKSMITNAEGDYIYDMIVYGPNTDKEPDISGQAAHVLKDYISKDYGLMIGHDTIYGYGGVSLNPNYVPDQNSITTPYYPGSGRVDGHYNMAWLVGSNKQYQNVSPYEAPSMILGIGDYTDKSAMYGDDKFEYGSTLRIKKAISGNPVTDSTLRTPTNFPFQGSVSGSAFTQGLTFAGTATHTNQQISFGTVWIEYATNTMTEIGAGRLVTATQNGRNGTNNFYLTTNGNIGMNQIGHQRANRDVVKYDESRILMNTILYLSQRQQCQVCQSEQNGHNELHHVTKIRTAEELSKIGNPDYWFTYPIDGHYILSADITLPEDWTPIEGFKGHFSADNYGARNGQLTHYRITLNSQSTPVFATSGADWNLGTNSNKGTTAISNNGTTTTGIARTVGYLNELFARDDANNWYGYIVVIEAPDGQKYYSKTNVDGKYIMSNLPTVGMMEAKVYKATSIDQCVPANGVPENGKIRVNILPEFWKTSDTTELFLVGFKASPIKDVTVYDGQDAVMVSGGVQYPEKVTNISYEVRKAGASNWIPISSSGFQYDIATPVYHAQGDLSWTEVKVTFKDVCIKDSEFNVRATFKNKEGEVVNTFDVGSPGLQGKVTVLNWPMHITDPSPRTVYIDGQAQFISSVETNRNVNTGLSVQWQVRKFTTDAWVNVQNYPDLNTAVTTTVTANRTDAGTIDPTLLPYKTTTSLTIKNTSIALNNLYFRALYTNTSNHAHSGYSVGSSDKSGLLNVLPPSIFVDWISGQNQRVGMTFEKPALITAGSEYTTIPVVYEADVIYRPGADETTEGTPSTEVQWKYRMVNGSQSITWNQTSANLIAANLGVTAPTVTFNTGSPVKLPDGSYKIHTTMTMNNISWKFYSDDCFLLFRAGAVNHYKTSPYKDFAGVSNEMPLFVDYKMGIKWNDGVRTDNGSYSTWTYPHMTVSASAGVKTLLLQFDNSLVSNYDARDRFNITSAPPGMTVAISNPRYVMFVSNTPVNQTVLENWLRTNVSVDSYDNATVNPKILAYIHAEKNLATQAQGAAAPLAAVPAGGPTTFAYPGTITVAWAGQLSPGSSAAAYASDITAPYYQWQINDGKGWQDCVLENNPTLIVSILYGNMSGWQYRLKYGNSATDYKTSNVITIAYNFKVTLTGESYASYTGNQGAKSGPVINVPAEYLGKVTHMTYDYEITATQSLNGDAFGNAITNTNNDSIPLICTTYASGTKTINGNIQFIYARAVQNADAYNFNVTMKITNVRIYGTTTGGNGDGIVIRRSPHEAWDLTTIYHQRAGEPNVVATTTSNGKVYDGTEVMAFTNLIDKENMLTPAQVNDIKNRGTIYYSNNTSTPGNATTGSNAIDAGTHTAQFIPAPEDLKYFASNNAEEIAGRSTTFIITQRPVNIYSYNNDKVYDTSDTATIKNVLFEAFNATNKTGIVPSDNGNVAVNPAQYNGRYITGKNQTNGGQVKIERYESSMISLAGSRAHNYVIAKEDYTGAISKRGVQLHSLYKDPGDIYNNPRNLKQYDGYVAGEINNILIDGILPGDTVTLDKKVIKGDFADKNSYEKLTFDGKVLEDRMEKLKEVKITRTESIALTGEEGQNYFIEKEDYSGAIYRRTTLVLVPEKTILYGEGLSDAFKFKSLDTYDASTNGYGSDLEISTLVGDDVLTIDNNKSGFVFNKIIDNRTDVGSYPVKYVGINETNYPVLSNYIVWQTDGSIEVVPRQLKISVDGGYQKYYGDINPEFSIKIEHNTGTLDADGLDTWVPGFVPNGDNIKNSLIGSLLYATDCNYKSPVLYDDNDNVLPYYVNASGYEVKENRNGFHNYELVWSPGDIKVLPRPITITPGDVEEVRSLEIVKKADKETAKEGDVINYTLTVKNTGTIEFNNLVVQDDNDGRNEIVVLPAQGYTYDSNKHFVIYRLPAGESIDIHYQYTVHHRDAGRIIHNIATVTLPPKDNDPGGKGTDIPSNPIDIPVTKDTPDTPIIPTEPNIDVSKRADVKYAKVGQIVTYTISVKNTGSQTLSNVTVDDNFDGSGDIKSFYSSEFEYLGNHKFKIPALDINQTVEIKYSYFVQPEDNAKTITNIATGKIPTDPSNPDGPGKEVPSNEVQVIIDDMNAGIIADPYRKIYGNPDPVFTWHYGEDLVRPDDIIGDLERELGEIVGIYEILRGTVASRNYDLSFLSNYLHIDPAILRIAVDGGYTKQYGDPLPKFDVNYSHNKGEKDAENNNVYIDGFIYSDTPANTLEGTLVYDTDAKFDSDVLYNPDGSYASYPIDASGLTIIANANGLYNYIIEWVPGDITITRKPIDVTPGNPEPHVTITKVADKTTANVGEKINYTVTVTNDGNTELTNVKVKDKTNGHGSITASNGQGYTYDDTTKTFNISVLPVGKTLTIKYTYTVQPEDAGKKITNVAVVTYPSDPSDPDSPDVEEETPPVIVDVPEKVSKISIYKEADRTHAKVGDTINYTLRVVNEGETDYTNLPVRDLNDGKNSIDVVAGTGYTYNNGIFTIAELKAGEEITITYSYVVVEGDNNSVVTNVAIVTVPVPPKENPDKGIEVLKSADKDIALVGETITYTVKVKNIGKTALVNVPVKDELLVKKNITPDNGTGYTYEGNGIFNIPSLGVGEEITITYKYVTTEEDANTIIKNVAVATIPGETPELPDRGISILKSANTNFAKVGDTVVYTLKVKNTGKTDLANVPVKDQLIVDRNINATDGTGYTYTGNGIFNITELKSGQEITITYSYVTTDADAGTVIKNVAVATIPGGPVDPADPDGPQNPDIETPSNEVDVPVENPNHGLTITKTADKTNASVGDVITYKLKLINTGNTDLVNFNVTDTSNGAGTISATDGKGYTYEGNSVFKVAELKAGKTLTITYTYTVVDVDAGKIISNVAIAKVPGGPVDPSNPDGPQKPDEEIPSNVVEVPIDEPGTGTPPVDVPSEEVDVPVIDPNNSLTIVKSADKTEASVGDIITYNLKVTNTGNTDFTNLPIKDTSSGNGNINATDGVGYTYSGDSKFVITELKTGESITLTYTYTVVSTDAGTTIRNIAVTTIPGGPVDPSNPDGPQKPDTEIPSNIVEVPVDEPDDTEDIVTPPVEVPVNEGLVIRKTADKAFAKVGETISYTISVTNIGDEDIENATITDTHDGKGTPEYTDGTGYTHLGNGKFRLPLVRAGETIEITYTYVVVKEDDNKMVTNAVVGKIPTDPFDPDGPGKEVPGEEVEVDIYNPELIKANPIIKYYGKADPELTYITSFPVLKPGDITGELVRVPGEHVGDYDIMQGSITSSNYEITYIPNIFRIIPATVRFIVDGGYSKYEFENNPPFYHVVEYFNGDFDSNGNKIFNLGLVLGDNIENSFDGTVIYPTSVDKTTTIGTYPVSIEGLSTKKNPNGLYNYIIEWVEGDITVLPKREGNIEVTKVADKESAKARDIITYTVTVKNTGNIDLNDIKVVDKTNGKGSISATDGDGYTYDAATKTFTIKSLKVGKTFTLTYTYEVQPEDAGTTVTNVAVGIIPPDPSDPDGPGKEVPTPPIDVPIEKPPIRDISVVKSADKTSGKVGETITYTVKVKNTGNILLDNVKVVDKTNGVGYITATDGNGYTYDAPTKTFTISKLDVGQEITITYTYVIQPADAGKEVKNVAVGIIPPDPLWPNVPGKEVPSNEVIVKVDAPPAPPQTGIAPQMIIIPILIFALGLSVLAFVLIKRKKKNTPET